MKKAHLTPADLTDKVIDCHSHLGVIMKACARIEYPYAQTAEGMAYKQQSSGVDINVVFPLAPEFLLDLPTLFRTGESVPAVDPVSPIPYALENELLLTEVYRFCPELSPRFIPFVSAHPGQNIDEQVSTLTTLSELFPIYGIKISPVFCQAPIRHLLGEGRALVELAESWNVPMLIHSTVDPNETWSQVRDILEVAETYPKVRICVAHCAGFDREGLERAHALPNVWVDSSALTIQVQLAQADSPLMAQRDRRFDADYTDPCEVMRALVAAYPTTMLWGSDSPAYAYICRRKQAEGVYEEFRLKATYEDEVEALNALSPDDRRRVSNVNTQKFLFG